jgi:phospho-N-acetylmuramoyl-pentapeptide-transferase
MPLLDAIVYNRTGRGKEMKDIFKLIPYQVAAYIAAFIIAVLSARLVIPLLRRLKCGQTVREDGPQMHLAKTGTPTMGGVLFLIPLVLVGGWYAFREPRIIPLILVTLAFSAIGFIDDFLKVVKKHNKGLNERQKMAGLLIVSGAFTWYAVTYIPDARTLVIPVLGIKAPVVLPLLVIVPFMMFVLVAFTNAVNFTDGLDGLAGCVTTMVLLFLALVTTLKSDWEYMRTFCAILAGGLLGFLLFNLHPARVFMGDMGSLALGGALTAVALSTGTAIFLGIAGIIYVVEALSVVIQVLYYKRTQKRFFLMAPIHHHYEHKGWKEGKVVAVFTLVTVAACAAAYLLLL